MRIFARAWIRQPQSGMVMLISVMVLALVLASGVTLMQSTNQGLQISGNNRQALQANYTAQAGAEYGLARVTNVYLANNPLDTTTIAFDTTIAYNGQTIPLKVRRPAGADSMVTVKTGPFNGLIGKLNSYTVQSDVNYQGKYASHVEENLEYWHIPLFQFAFVQQQIPGTPTVPTGFGSSMDFNGPVHINGNYQLSCTVDNTTVRYKNKLTVTGKLTTVQSMAFTTEIDITNGASDVPILRTPAPGPPIQFSDSAAITPDWHNTALANWKGYALDQSHGVTPLNLPVPPGYNSIEIIKPKTGSEIPALKAVKLAYQCSWLLDAYFDSTGSLYQVTVQDKNGNPVALDNTIFSGGVFFSMWELCDVALVKIDLRKLKDSGMWPPNGAMYVNAHTPDHNSHKQAGVLLYNGEILPNNLSVISNNFICVKGNFNNGDTAKLWDSTSSYVPKNTALMCRSVYYFTRYWSESVGNFAFFCVSPNCTNPDAIDTAHYCLDDPANYNTISYYRNRRWQGFPGNGAGGRGFPSNPNYILEVRTSTLTTALPALGGRVQENFCTNSGNSGARYITRTVGSGLGMLIDPSDPQWPDRAILFGARNHGASLDMSPGFYPSNTETLFDTRLLRSSGLPPATPVAVNFQRSVWVNQNAYANK